MHTECFEQTEKIKAENAALKNALKDICARVEEMKFLYSKPFNTRLKIMLHKRRGIDKCNGILTKVEQTLKSGGAT